MIDSNVCVVAGCTHRIQPATLACKKHWFLLPPDLRSRIHGARRQFMKAATDYKELRSQAIEIMEVRA